MTDHRPMPRRIEPLLIALVVSLGSCLSAEPDVLAPASPSATTVRFDFDHRPLPEIPLPNDIATRFDADSPTGLRLNASVLAPTDLEASIRRKVDELDGWGVMQHITIPFTGPIDVESLIAGHRDVDYRVDNDVLLLINVTEGPSFGTLHHLDVGNGNYPVLLERRDYWKNDPRGWLASLLFEEEDEDRNGNGILDPGGDADGDGQLSEAEWPEDTDGDGVLDAPNYYDGLNPARDDWRGRADALMTFYERETNTIIARPMVPLEERSTYAVVVTKRLKDVDGQSVGSPFQGINHASQTRALKRLGEALPDGFQISDIAFAWSFTTQSIQSHWKPVRDGLYGQGVQGHLGASFPARLAHLSVLRNPSSETWKNVTNPFLIYWENILPVLPVVGSELLGLDANSKQWERLVGGLSHLDFLSIGVFDSPQLFHRVDENGDPISVNEQTWPPDLDRKPAVARSEDVTFTLYVPRRESSVRKDDRMVPVILHGHGYTSNRLEALNWAGFFARHGIATLAIDCPSHGISLSEDEAELATSLLGLLGLDGFLEEFLRDRAVDMNGDGEKDSGADFWSSYLFHTRDMVRQCSLDYMQLIRILRTWDGQKTWDWDVNGNGEADDIAGDFDGDGHVDVGVDSVIGMTGSSLGGIMASMVASLEPELTAAVPICGGGGLTDVGNRSLQGGVREAVQLRLMAPLYTGTIRDDGLLRVETIVADLNRDKTLRIADVSGVIPGDTVVGRNLRNGEIRCGYVSREGVFRFGIPSDIGDATELEIYRGPVLTGDGECDIREGATPFTVIAALERDLEFQGEAFSAGEPLKAFAEGLALRRGSPEFRRLISLAQLAVDPADPGVLAPNLGVDPIIYPASGAKTGAHTVIVTTMGDMNVPASSGVTQARAAGFIAYLDEDPRYGMSANQKLIETGALEAVHLTARYTDNEGSPVHIDLENFSVNDDPFAYLDVPRLDPPMRLLAKDSVCDGPEGCGVSGALFPYANTDGKHDLPIPGNFWDQAVDRCKTLCESDQTDCGACDDVSVFDTGLYFYNAIARYVNSAGTVWSTDVCNGYGTCTDWPEEPQPRPTETLP